MRVGLIYSWLVEAVQMGGGLHDWRPGQMIESCPNGPGLTWWHEWSFAYEGRWHLDLSHGRQ